MTRLIVRPTTRLSGTVPVPGDLYRRGSYQKKNSMDKTQ